MTQMRSITSVRNIMIPNKLLTSYLFQICIIGIFRSFVFCLCFSNKLLVCFLGCMLSLENIYHPVDFLLDHPKSECKVENTT